MPNPTAPKTPEAAKAAPTPQPKPPVKGGQEGKVTENKPATPAPKPVETPAAAKPVINWDVLPAATPDTGVAAGDRVDIMKEVPPIVRKDVEESLAKYLEKAKTAEAGTRVAPEWMIKDLPDETTAKEYTRLIK